MGRVIFSDERKLNLFGSNGIKYVRRRSGEHMVWGCFSYHGLGELAFVKGMIKSNAYKVILTNHLIPCLENHLSVTNKVIFQDGSAL